MWNCEDRSPGDFPESRFANYCGTLNMVCEYLIYPAPDPTSSEAHFQGRREFNSLDLVQLFSSTVSVNQPC